ncbi:MAG: signal recognition particle protein [Armatimonadetes bacterium CG_4_10_14_3_um_filter_66_18]|nr:signal recognition particle protein [Armatimonadota bacterium]OIP12163.1 MAG: signal recognition particle protein [Armatimonadetes bacterium CG2_30_66_41]PIU92490.1 MAG: signal recognition particle protein [Armatimonadetes bacterium CG06_land_8_20_14_3_00_66_21]PIX49258.1 MAG: signal recognition particle protein [Armatimonadetes bacterium CG_4_8_14_3_um_filter_66_20]PIY38299.1 MAG: signal recognition particle protein [Armatimonadetes bacterium CG_4_10_14_3_um_filter_66_18]PJB69897.1 MAG: si
MLEALTQKLQLALRGLRGKGRLTEKDVDAALREIRLSLLEADVNFQVVKDFVARVREQAVGQEVLKSLSPDQRVVQIVHDALMELLGSEESTFALGNKPPAVVMLVGLQGSGKTTFAGKLALNLKDSERRKPLLVAADLKRPAAVEQLQKLASEHNLPVFEIGRNKTPAQVARAAVAHARSENLDTVIIDTAGRQTVDAEMMAEAVQIRDAVKPQQTLFVVDAMTGQDAVNVAATFDKEVGIDGVVLTKLDGDARGGAVLSIRQVTGKPVMFVSTGERLDALELFHPERMASRILGMGDVLTLIEKAEAAFTEEEADELERKLLTEEFSFEDLLAQLHQMKKMGPLDQLLGMIPGFGGGMRVDEKQLARNEAIIKSMTQEERARPSILSGSRKRRIARGSGTSQQMVNQLINQFNQMKRMMKQMAKEQRKMDRHDKGQAGTKQPKAKKGKSPHMPSDAEIAELLRL